MDPETFSFETEALTAAGERRVCRVTRVTVDKDDVDEVLSDLLGKSDFALLLEGTGQPNGLGNGKSSKVEISAHDCGCEKKD